MCVKILEWLKTKFVNDHDGYDELPKWKPMPFNETFRESLLGMDLNHHAKKVILMRYVELVLDVKQKHRNVLRSYNLLRVTTLLSGLVTPVFFSITNDVPNSAALFWVTLVTSLAGSISNAWLEFFSITKLHYTYLYTSETLESEGWHFASLTGPYRKYNKHYECWQRFVLNTERIHFEGVNRYMINSQPQNRVASGKELMKEAKLWKKEEEVVVKANVGGDESSESSIEKMMVSGKRSKGLRRRIGVLSRQTSETSSNNEENDSNDDSRDSNSGNDESKTPMCKTIDIKVEN